MFELICTQREARSLAVGATSARTSSAGLASQVWGQAMRLRLGATAMRNGCRVLPA